MFVGINSYFEHPSVAIVEDSNLLYASEDERFTGLKGGKSYNPHHAYLPLTALFRGLQHLGRSAKDIQGFAFSYSPFLHLASLGGCFTGARLSKFREEFGAFFSALQVRGLLGTNYGYRPEFRKILSPADLRKVKFTYLDHHLCHAASAFYLSGFESAAVITADGAGERAAARVSVGQGGTIRTVLNHNLPNSLGHLYSFVTEHIGFKPFSDEYKVMGLAGYGTDSYAIEFSKLLQLQPGGRFRVNLALATNLTPLFGPPRSPEQEISQRERDIACSLQKALERAIMHIIVDARKRTGMRNACFAGGVFMNSVVNGLITESKIFDRVFFMPAASDAGTAIGAAAILNARANPHLPQITYPGMFLGTEYSDDKAARVVREFTNVESLECDDNVLAERMATELAAGNIGATFRGRMEFGDRALGNRSILADPGVPAIVEILNSVKGREMFRPVAPVVLRSAVREYFEGDGNEYMMATCRVREDKKQFIRGCVHVDGTARVQVIDDDSDTLLAKVLKEFRKRKGYPVLVNTSFNLHGQPMIEHPRQAMVALQASRLSFLAMNNMFVRKQAA
jgi:carbamoyltransferase